MLPLRSRDAVSVGVGGGAAVAATVAALVGKNVGHGEIGASDVPNVKDPHRTGGFS
jgi:hypothetical protein